MKTKLLCKSSTALIVLMEFVFSHTLISRTLHLHLEPSSESAQVLVVELPNPDVLEMPDEEGVVLPQGWRRFIWEGGVAGFVPVAEIAKNLEPAQGAPLHLADDPTSPIILELNDGDPVEILETGDWWRVFVEIPVVLYARVPTTDDDAIAVTGLEAILAPALEPASESPPAPSPSPEPAVVVDSTAAPLTVPRSLQRPEVPLQASSQRQPGQALGMPILFEGIVQRAPVGVFARAPFPFQLVTAEGSRIAWLDTRDLVLSGTMADWLGRTVVIQGEETSRGSRGELVLKVRSMRAK